MANEDDRRMDSTQAIKAYPRDYARWLKAAKIETLGNYSEFARRALNERADKVLEGAKEKPGDG